MTEKTKSESPNEPIEGEFIGPKNFVYTNAHRMYGTGAEVFVEFGRSTPVAPGERPRAIGEIGVVMSIQTANNLIGKLQTTIMQQLSFMQEQTKRLEEQAQQMAEVAQKGSVKVDEPDAEKS